MTQNIKVILSGMKWSRNISACLCKKFSFMGLKFVGERNSFSVVKLVDKLLRGGYTNEHKVKENFL